LKKCLLWLDTQAILLHVSDCRTLFIKTDSTCPTRQPDTPKKLTHFASTKLVEKCGHYPRLGWLVFDKSKLRHRIENAGSLANG
jgi:hypothetical protein